MKALTLATLALLGFSGAALAAPEGDADTASGLIEAAVDGVEVDGVAARTPTKRRTSSAKRPAASGSRGAHGATRTTTRTTTTRTTTARPPASRPSTSARPPATRPATTHRAGPPAQRPSTSHSSARPARPHSASSHSSARPGSSHSARPHTSHRPQTSHQRPHTVHVGHHQRPHRVIVYHRPVRYYHGVFVYGPRPVYHSSYYGAPQPEVRKAHLPKRHVERDDTLAIGVRTGALYGAYDLGTAYGDMGIGANVRYRPQESLGLELAISMFDQTFEDDSERTQVLTQGSVELFAFPWARVSPYVIGGVTYNSRDIEDCFEDGTVETQAALWGPHAGVGLEIALGDNLALDLEGRYVSYLNADPTDLTVPAGLQTTAGLVYHF